MTDRTLGERYRLDRKLGEGGMAIVYSGTDTVLRRRVAVKVLRPQFAADAEFVRRFYHEAEAAARLSYPNIVSIYDVGNQDDTYFIVMELVDGTTLAELIEGDGRLPESVAVDYAEQICRGLAYAHRQGILHRDVKPANILITKDDVVKLSDFGIARAVTTQTMTMTMPGMVMGSVFYLSPEQAQGHELRETSDLYSLGVVLYQMLSGSLPYTGDSPVTVALKHVSSPVPELESADGINPALATIARRLLQKDPANRYQSATEVASALREAREQPLQATVATQRRRGRPAAIPNPPPRRSQAPDIRTNGSSRDGALHWSRRPSRRVVAGLVALLALAAWAGYYLASRPGGPLGNIAALAVPSVVGSASADARQALARAGFRIDVAEAPSDLVERDRVVAQDPAAGGHTKPDGVVHLVVSSGPPIVSLIDLRSYSREDAERYLHHAKLSERVVEKFNVAPRGTVLQQSPPPGPLPARSVVTLTLSKGPSPVSVPSVVTMSVDEATVALKKAGLKIEIGERVASDNIPQDVIASQSPESGASADTGSAVIVTVSSGPASVSIPEVGGRGVGDADAALRDAGLIPAYDYAFEPGNPVGVVINVNPSPGTHVRHGSTVVLTIVVSGIVPDVAGMTLDQAKAALQNAGYRIGNVAYTQSGPEGAVASTEPRAGSTLKPGETVLIYFNDGAAAPAQSAAPAAPAASAPASPAARATQ